MIEDKLERELIKLVNEAVEHRQSIRDREYITNMAHYEGLHWNLAENKEDSPFMLKSDINHLKNAVDLRLGSLFSESYFGELQPLSPNDIEAVDVLNTLYKNEWIRLNADDYVEEAIKQGAIHDNGYVEVNFDEGAIYGGTGTRNEGSITLKTLSTSDVYLDPKASSIDECEYIVIKHKCTKDWIKRHKDQWLSKMEEHNLKMGNIDTNLDGNIYVGRDYSSLNESYVIDIIERKYPEKIEIPVKDSNGEPIVNEQGEPVVEEIMTTKVKIHYILDDVLLETNEAYPFSDFNIIPFQWEAEAQSAYGIPLLRGLTIPQKVANLVESAANNVAMHYATPTWLVSEESGLDIDDVSQLSNAVGLVWKVTGDVNNAMKQMDYPDVNEQLIAIKESFVQNIKDYAGISDTYMGNIGTAGSTAEGTNKAVNRATIIDNAPIKQIEKFVEKLSRMIIKYMTRYYKNQTIYVRDTEKLEGKAYTFGSFLMDENYQNINYDFNVKLAGRSKSDKNRQYNLMKELYTIQNQYKEDKKVINVTDLAKAAQLDNFNELYKRLSNITDEALNEKADLIVQIMTIGSVVTPNGDSLITAQEMQQGILDVLDDNGDLSMVESIFNTYKEYQTQITELKNQLYAQQQQRVINRVNDQNTANEQQLQQGIQNIINQTGTTVENR